MSSAMHLPSSVSAYRDPTCKGPACTQPGAELTCEETELYARVSDVLGNVEVILGEVDRRYH